MLVKMFKRGAKTDEEYREKQRLDIKLDIMLGIVGVIAAVLGTFYLFRVEDGGNAFVGGLFVGTGIAIIIGAIQAVLKACRLLKNEELLRKERLKATDERNRFIGMSAFSSAGLITIGLCYIGMLVSVFFNIAVMWTLWGVLMFYFITVLILKKYLEKKL